MALKARPCTLKQANEAIASLHRHHKPVRGHRFSIAAYDADNNRSGRRTNQPTGPKRRWRRTFNDA